jgi:hypothetical protein
VRSVSCGAPFKIALSIRLYAYKFDFG